MQKSVKDANQKLKDAEQRKKERLRKMQKMKEHLMIYHRRVREI